MAELLAEGQGVMELWDMGQQLNDVLVPGEIGQVRIYGPVEVPQELLDLIEAHGPSFGLTWAESPRAEGKTLIITFVKQNPAFAAVAGLIKFIISNAFMVAIAFLIASFSFQFLKLNPEEAQQTMHWLVIAVAGVAGLLLWQVLQSSRAPRGYGGYLD